MCVPPREGPAGWGGRSSAPVPAAVAARLGGRAGGLAAGRPCSGTSRIGPLHAPGPEVAAALVHALAATAPATAVAVDVPEHKAAAVR
ncbi:hypothetical protein [Streptomyces sp. NPDC018833]|uniref:hypothetical protein n=1 Tax=Streptomyces sp. NPDC018833 TaxID=3365053 RepID=UPI0037880DA3